MHQVAYREQANSNTLLISFICKVLRPLVRFLIRNRFAVEQLNEICRWLYIDVVRNEPEFWGRDKFYKSRGAVLSGLSRKEVLRLTRMDTPLTITDKLGHAERVLGGWVRDPQFADSGGEPVALPMRSGRGVDFYQLVKQHGDDVPPRTVLQELIRVGAVEDQGDETYRVVQKGFVPEQVPDKQVEFGGILANHLLSTIVHSLKSDSINRCIAREWEYNWIPRDNAMELKGIVEERTIAHGRQMDAIMAEFRHARPMQNIEYVQFGLGSYTFLL